MDRKAAAALEHRRESCSSPGPITVEQCLVRCHGITRKDSCSLYNIFEPNKKDYGQCIPELSGTEYYQKASHQGWLIIICDYEDYDYSPRWNHGDCFLWNPVTNQTIQLPALKDEYGHLCDCVCPLLLTSQPIGVQLILLILKYYEEENNSHGYRFLFCRPGETQWRIHKLSPDIVDFISERDPEAVLCLKGKLYLMCADVDNLDDKLDHYLEIERITKDPTDLTLSINPFHVKKDASFPLVNANTYVEVRYVECHDELFRVIIIIDRYITRVNSIHVVRLNFSSMEWEKVSSLGDHVLFVGYHPNTTGCCSAAELGLTSGCLYYWSFLCQSLHKFEIESTCDTLTSPCRTEIFSYRKWVIMPLNVQGRVKSTLSKDGENGFLKALEIETISNMVVKDENLVGNRNAGEMEAASYWNNLNANSVAVIAIHLHGLDYKHFRSMCKGNSAIIPEVQPTSYLSPWLVFSKDHKYSIYKVVNPMYNDEDYAINFHDLAGSTICFQKGGWLLMMRKENLFFYNPFTRETVKLPDMDLSNYSVVSFSSLPTSFDCIVFAMDHRTDGVYIKFIGRGEAHWSSRVFDNSNIKRGMQFLSTAVFLDGAFFCIGKRGTVGVFSTKAENWKFFKKPHEKYYQGYLVECFGDLLLVQLNYHWRPIRIFRLNLSEMEWVKVESLGEHMLFISDTSCVLAVAPNSNMKNNIYLPRLHLNCGGIVFYSLETASYHSVGSNHSANNLYDTQGWLGNCTWIQPNKLKSTPKVLDWLRTPSL